MKPNAIPIRWRLNFWYLSYFVAMLVLFAGSLYFGLRFFLYRSLDSTLENQAELLIESIDMEEGQPTVGDRRVQNRPGRRLVRLVDENAELLTGVNSTLDSVPANNPGARAALDGHYDYRWITVDGEEMRVLSQPVEIEGEIVGAVQVGLPDSSIEQTLRATLFLIVITGGIVLLLVSVGGVWLAGRALEPIDRITRLAQRIGARELAARIDTPPADDEVGRLATTFNAMLDRLESSIERQRQFTASASHELRTPLALMQSQIETALAQERAPEADRQVLESLGTDVSRLTRISNTLLVLARSDAGELQLERVEVDLQSLGELVAEQYTAVAEASGVEIHVNAEPVRFIGDEDRLIQLLVNLLDNALRHTPSGKCITLRCDSEPDHVTISVMDEGVGIEPHHLPHVFDRFYRPDSSRARAHSGAGLGLSISKMIVDAHRGSIDIASEAGKGTNVYVTLPLAGPATG